MENRPEAQQILKVLGDVVVHNYVGWVLGVVVVVVVVVAAKMVEAYRVLLELNGQSRKNSGVLNDLPHATAALLDNAVESIVHQKFFVDDPGMKGGHSVDATTGDTVKAVRLARVETRNDHMERPYSYSARTVTVMADLPWREDGGCEMFEF